MKLHWCCGDIYLDGYINMDVVGIERDKALYPDINDTTLEHYYKRPFNEEFSKRERKGFVVDRIENILRPWPFGFEEVDEIVMISCIEHFSKFDALIILSEVKRVLKRGGRFIVDFPDIRKNIGLYYNIDPDFMMELIYCNGKDARSVHKWGYTAKSFTALWEIGKFVVGEKRIVKHDYPMIGMEVTKL